MSKEELMQLRRELTIKRSAIDNKLDSQAYGDMDEEEIRELEEKYDECGELIQEIDKILDNLLNIKKR